MKLKLFALQTVGTAAALAAFWALLLVPDSSVGYLALSLLLMYVILFALSFTLAAVAGGMASANGWRLALLHGWRRWYRAAAVLLAAGGVFYGLYRLGWLRASVWLPVAVLALLAVPAVVERPRLDAGWRSLQLVRKALSILLAVLFAFLAWKLLDLAVAISRPWLEVAWLGARVLVSFLALNLACMLLLAAGQFTTKPQSPQSPQSQLS